MEVGDGGPTKVAIAQTQRLITNTLTYLQKKTDAVMKASSTVTILATLL